MIQAGTASQSQAMPLVRLAQDNVLRLVLPVPESAVSRIRMGSTMDVIVPSLHKTFPGRVARTADTLQMSTRTMDTQVDVANPNYMLVPGMYAEVNLRLDEHNNVLAVPVDSVRGPGADAHVFVVQDGKLHSHRHRHGPRNGAAYEVRSGLREGDLVVVGRAVGLEGRPAGAGQNRGLRRKLTDPKQCLTLPSERLT